MSKMWFRPKRYGFGAGLPLTWEGWAVLGLYVAALMVLLWYTHERFDEPQRVVFQAGGVLLLSFVLIVIAHAKTEGGWRWRWGKDQD